MSPGIPLMWVEAMAAVSSCPSLTIHAVFGIGRPCIPLQTLHHTPLTPHYGDTSRGEVPPCRSPAAHGLLHIVAHHWYRADTSFPPSFSCYSVYQAAQRYLLIHQSPNVTKLGWFNQ